MLTTRFSAFCGFLALLLGLLGCGGGVSSQLTPKPLAFGDVNRVNILADEVLQNGVVGDSLKYYYEQAYRLMPQPEPIYDVQWLTYRNLEELAVRQELRTYVVVADLNDSSSPITKMVEEDIKPEKIQAARNDWRKGTSIVTNRWAQDQLLIYLFAEGQDNLGNLVAQSFPAAKKRITAADLSKLMGTIYQGGKSSLGIDSVRHYTGLEVDVPGEYIIAKAEENTIWLRRDIREVIQNLIISSVPYTGTDQISSDSLVALRNRLGMEHVTSDTKGSYMSTNNVDLPVLTEVTDINGRYTMIGRGVWEMTDDFMGGPFFTYLIPNAEAGRLYIVDAFVYAPAKKKRNYMQQLETIVGTIRLPKG